MNTRFWKSFGVAHHGYCCTSFETDDVTNDVTMIHTGRNGHFGMWRRRSIECFLLSFKGSGPSIRIFLGKKVCNKLFWEIILKLSSVTPPIFLAIKTYFDSSEGRTLSIISVPSVFLTDFQNDSNNWSAHVIGQCLSQWGSVILKIHLRNSWWVNSHCSSPFPF